MNKKLETETMSEFINRHKSELEEAREKTLGDIETLMDGRDEDVLDADELTELGKLNAYRDQLNFGIIDLETMLESENQFKEEDAIGAERDRVGRIVDKMRGYRKERILTDDATAITLPPDTKLKEPLDQREVEGTTGITKVTVGISGVVGITGERDELLKQALTLESMLESEKLSADERRVAKTMLYRIKIQLEKSYSKSVKALEKDPVETLETKIESPVIKDDENPKDKPPVTKDDENPQQAISVGPIKNFIISILNKLKSIFNPNSKMYKLLDKATLSLCSKQNAVLISDGDNKKKAKNIVKQVEQEELEEQEEPKSEVQNDEKKDEERGFLKRIFDFDVNPDEEIDDEEGLEDKIAKEGMTWLADKNKEYARDPEHYLWVEKIYNAKVLTFNCKYGRYGGCILPFAYSEVDSDVSQKWWNYNETAVCDAVESLEIPRIDSWHKEKLDEAPVKELFYYSYARGIIEKAKEIDGFSLTDKDGNPKSLETIAGEYERYDLRQKTNDVSRIASERKGGETPPESISIDVGRDK